MEILQRGKTQIKNWQKIGKTIEKLKQNKYKMEEENKNEQQNYKKEKDK